MMLRRFALLALIPAALAACRDTTNIGANTLVAPDTLVAYALTGTSSNLPTALNTVGRTTVRITGTGDFDVGFDINPDTTISVIPARQLVNLVAGTRTVGLYVSPVAYDSVLAAPDVYYRPDTTVIVRPHQTVVILSNRTALTDICAYFASPRVYAKFVIDSVNVVNRSIYLRQVVDANCGFRSFLPGYPAS